MEYPLDVVIKEEPTYDYEEQGNVLEVEFDVKVKVEKEDTSITEKNCCVEKPVPMEQVVVKRSEHKRLECHLCHKHFNKRHTLMKHNLDHMKIVLEKCIAFKCNTCLIYFTNEDKLKAHMQEHVETEKDKIDLNIPVTKIKHQCRVCGKVLSYKSWHEHMRQVHAQERVPCLKCGKDFKCLRTLIRHNKYVHEGVIAAWRTQAYDNLEMITCSVCGKIFSNKSALKTHMGNCHSGQKFPCYICKSALKSKSYLMTHIRRVHFFDGKEYFCEICGKKFKLPRYLKVHKRKRHQDDKITITVKLEETDED